MINENGSLIQKDIHHVSTTWCGKMHFDSLANDHIIHTDKLPQHGGEDKGPRPKPLILASIGACTGMEIMAIIDKMRIKIDSLSIDVTGELTEDIPKMYKTVNLIFKVQAQNHDKEKIEKAIKLALDKYCGVVAMVRKFADVTSEVKFIN